jgi:hypothetical protein
MVDAEGHKFVTRSENIFVVGKDKSLVTLPSEAGIKVSIEKNRELRLASMEKKQKTE